jgi:hypothetical protein
MNVTTVGELIIALRDFDPATPIIKSDPAGNVYYDVTLTEKMLFTVAADGFNSGIECYKDGATCSNGAGVPFDAVVL